MELQRGNAERVYIHWHTEPKEAHDTAKTTVNARKQLIPILMAQERE